MFELEPFRAWCRRCVRLTRVFVVPRTSDAEVRLRELLATGFAGHRLSGARPSLSFTNGRIVPFRAGLCPFFLFVCAEHEISVEPDAPLRPLAASCRVVRPKPRVRSTRCP